MRIVVSYRGIPGRPGWACGDSVARALTALGHEVYRYGNIYQTEERIDPQPMPWDRPDLLLWMECNDSDPQYFELLTLPCKKVLWDFDTEMHSSFTVDLSSGFDRCFLANIKWARNLGCKYLPYAFDDELMEPHGQKGPLFAIVGTPFPERVDFAQEVGVGMISGVYGQDYVDTVSWLSCHVHHYSSGGSGLLVNRIWETLGLGTLLMAPSSDHVLDTLGEDFPVIVYGSTTSAKIEVAIYRNRPGLVESMARESRERILAAHTYRHRVARLLELL